jgi:hypothetical protein
MSKGFYAAFVPLFAVAAFALAPAVAQAAPKWEICKHEATATHKFSDSECQKEVVNTGFWEWVAIPNGVANQVQVVTFGKLTLHASNGIVIVCKKVDAGNIWNLAAGGFDNIEVFVNYECTSEQCVTRSVTAKGLPWTSEVVAGPVDKIKGIEVTVKCEAAELTFKGELSPKLVNGTETEPTVDEFTAATGELEEPTMGLKAKVEGKDRILGFAHGEPVRVK